MTAADTTTTRRAASPRGSGTPRRRRHRLTFDKVSFMVVFLGVPLAVYAVFVLSPFVQACYFALTRWSGFDPNPEFIGFENFVRLFQDQTFLKALGNNVILLVVIPPVTIFLALVLATIVTMGGPTRGQIRGIKGAGFYRVVSFFPYVVPAIAIGLMWLMIFDPSSGPVNSVLTAIGLDQFQSYPWLGRVLTAMPVTIFVIVWAFVGFYMILFVAAIKGIPSEIYEAARIDGAGRWRTLWSVTLPQVRSNVQTAWIYLGIFALDAFVYLQALNANGGPENSTLVMGQYLYRTAFTKNQFGMATATGVVMAIITLAFAALVFLVNHLTGGSEKEERR